MCTASKEAAKCKDGSTANADTGKCDDGKRPVCADDDYEMCYTKPEAGAEAGLTCPAGDGWAKVCFATL